MSTYTVALWKAPVVREPDEAEALLRPYGVGGDDSAFEPSADVAAVANELVRRFPDSESEEEGPWESPPYQTDRVLYVTIGGVDDERFKTVTDAIFALAREHGLIVYDLEGPSVHLPDDPLPEPDQPPTLIDNIKFAAFFGGVGLVGAGVFWVGWRIDVPVLDWLLMIVGGFFALMPVVLLHGFLRPERK